MSILEETTKVYPTVEEVLAKETWYEDDIDVLMAHVAELDAATLAKLGVPVEGSEATVEEEPKKAAKK